MRPALLLALTACAATGYHARASDGGFSDDRLDDTTFQVSFQGNEHTSPDQVADFALLRSAEVARDHGFGFFVVKSRQGSSAGSYQGSFATHTTMHRSKDGGAMDAETTTAGRGSAPRGSVFVIGCFKEKPQRDNVYEARDVVQSLTQKYGLSPGGSKSGP